jgi:hypothetical protein
MSPDTLSARRADARPADLFDFFERVRTTNPFLSNRVDRALDRNLLDVETIHQAAFEKVVSLGQQAFAGNRGLGVVVWGEAGVGKSHLLARLNRWASQRPAACAVYLHNLQASPERLPRYVLRSILHALTRGEVRPLSRSPLFGLLNDALAGVMRPQGKARGTWEQIEEAHAHLVARLAAQDPSGGILFDRTAHDVLFRFYRHAHPSGGGAGEEVAALAVRWLSGEALDWTEARRLGLPPQRGSADPVALADNQHVKQVVVALTQLARAAGRLLLLGLDQVDNLDEEQVCALARFLHDLLDSAGNLLIVTTGVKSTLLSFLQRGVITETSWDRIGQFEIALGRLRREQGWELLRAHLQRFLQPFRGLKEVEARLREDPLFPLGVAWFDARLRDLIDFRPRDLLGWACERWQRLQEQLTMTPGPDWFDLTAKDGKPPAAPPEDPQVVLDRAVEQKVAEQRARRLRELPAPPIAEEHLLGLLEAALKACLDRPYRLQSCHRNPLPRNGPRPAYDLTLEQTIPDGPPLRLGVRVLAAEHGRGVTTALERIALDPHPPCRVLLVTDERHPLPLGQKGAELLAELEARGPQTFRWLKVPAAQLADLEALETVVALARGGDFEVATANGERRAVSEDDVVAAYHRADRYLAIPLLRELLGGAAALAGSAPVPPAAPAPLDERAVGSSR